MGFNPILTANEGIERAKKLYNRYEKYFPVLFFFGGFTWDSLTLTRIDQMTDNLIFLAYIILAGICIWLIQINEHNLIQNQLLINYSAWFPFALQFFLGGLFSGYVIFYFQSAGFTKSWLFLLLLVFLLIANEFLEKRLVNLRLVITLYFIAAFSFFIFFLPILTKKMNYLTFLSGALLGLGLVSVLLYFILKKTQSLTLKHYFSTGGGVFLLFLLLLISYQYNWIPPVPLSLKTGKIYHRVVKKGDFYEVRFEKPKWYQIFRDSDKAFHYLPGDTVFCFASIFAPTKLEKTCYHRWQFYNSRTGKWQTTDRIGYSIFGGRDGGYRGYTFKRNIMPGKWRVDVITDDGLILGRISFNVVAAEDSTRALKTEIL